jgi:hypothetical protein
MLANGGKWWQMVANGGKWWQMGEGKKWLFLPGQEPLRSLPQRWGIGLKNVAEVRLQLQVSRM